MYYNIQSLLPHLEAFAEECPDFSIEIPSSEASIFQFDLTKSFPHYNNEIEEKLSKLKIRLQPTSEQGIPIMRIYLKEKLSEQKFQILKSELETHPEVANVIDFSVFIFTYEYPCHINHNTHLNEVYHIIHKVLNTPTRKPRKQHD